MTTRHAQTATSTPLAHTPLSVGLFPPPVRLPPLTPEQIQTFNAEQREFDRRFPPLRHRDDDILIVSWSEIRRQYLDLCAPWDRSEQALIIQAAEQTSAHESSEKTLRGLFVLNSMRTSIDTPMPRRLGIASHRR
jgi:hypothetical protein